MTPNDVTKEMKRLLTEADEEMKQQIADGQGLPFGQAEDMVGAWEAICRVFQVEDGSVLSRSSNTPLAPETLDNIEDTLRFIGAAIAAAKEKHPAPMKIVSDDPEVG